MSLEWLRRFNPGIEEVRMNKASRLRNIPVVVLSAMGETVQPIEVDHLLRKPVDCEKLISVIERFRRRTPT
jgi:CheY-like chemotaxis protein